MRGHGFDHRLGRVHPPVGGQRHHVMGIGEGQLVVARVGLGLVGQLDPATADIDAGLLQPPQQRGGIGDVQVVVGLFGTDAVVVAVQNRVVTLQIHQQQRPVPPQVIGKIIAVGPDFLGRLQPVRALAVAALHLQNVGHGMDRPDVRRIDRHRTMAHGFRIGEVAAFLQPEGVHAQHEAVAGRVFVPGIEHAGNGIAYIAGVAEIEIAAVGKLQRQHVQRVFQQDFFPQFQRALPIFLMPGGESRDMVALALGGAALQGRFPGSSYLRADPLVQRADGEEFHETAAGHMAHQKIRIGLQGQFQVVACIAVKSQPGRDGIVEMANGVSAGRGVGHIPPVVLNRYLPFRQTLFTRIAPCASTGDRPERMPS